MADWTACPNCDAEVRGEWRNLDGAWDGPEEQRPYTVTLWDRHDCPGTFNTGAAVAFGLMGMADAIRERRWHCGRCDGWNLLSEEECDFCSLYPRTDHDRSKADGT